MRVSQVLVMWFHYVFQNEKPEMTQLMADIDAVHVDGSTQIDVDDVRFIFFEGLIMRNVVLII